jgi:monoamine oxidase
MATLRTARAAWRGKSVLVVGAGMAGLSAARALHDAGFDTSIIEARTRLGGRINTCRESGCTVDFRAE